MDILLILTYAAICIAVFKLFRIPVHPISLLTAALGGVFLIGFILLAMNYNHPFSSQGRFYYQTTPIIPLVSGRVVEAPLRAGDRVKKGDLLFKLDGTHFRAAVDSLNAQLAAAGQSTKTLASTRQAAEAKVAEARTKLDRARDAYERVANLGGGAVSRQEVDNKNSLFLTAKSELSAAESNLESARLAETSEIDGINTTEARLRAELADAEFQLSQTTVLAPTDGTVQQSFLREGMMAAQLPLRPVMVFNHDEPATFAAAFLQNSAQRLEPGSKAEVSFPAVPGRVFPATIKNVQNAIAQGQLQPTGDLVAPESIHGEGRIMVTFVFTDPASLAEHQLLPGTTGIAAVYSDHLHELAVMRKVLLRMKSWTHYLFSDGH